MSKIQVDVQFNEGFKGQLIAQNATVPIGVNIGEVRPYDMLLGALASCLFATFMDVAKKKQIHYDSVAIHVDGEKREEVPMTLKEVDIQFAVKGATNEQGLAKAMDLACKYCSIYQTIAHVATMTHNITFE